MGDKAGNLLVEKIDIVLGLLFLRNEAGVPVQHGLKSGGDIGLGHAEHPFQLLVNLADINGGQADSPVLVGIDWSEIEQTHPFFLVFWPVR